MLRSTKRLETNGKRDLTVTSWNGNSPAQLSPPVISISMPCAFMVMMTLSPLMLLMILSKNITRTTLAVVSVPESNMLVVSQVSLKSGPSGLRQLSWLIGLPHSVLKSPSMTPTIGETRMIVPHTQHHGSCIVGYPRMREVKITTRMNIDLRQVIMFKHSRTLTPPMISIREALKPQ